MSKIFHVKRDLSKSLKQQKRELSEAYDNFYYIGSDGRQIDFIADEKRKVDHTFITVKEFIEWLMRNKGTDLGFTLDTKEEVEECGEGIWYGAVIDDRFDGDDFLIGEYGIGIVFEGNRLDSPIYSNYLKLMQEFFEDEGNVIIGEESWICVWAEDLMKGD